VEAVRLFTLSANQGYSDAQVNLGLMYVKGHGVNQDKIAAYNWWQKSAKQGNTTTQRNLDLLCNDSPWACK
jgi:TPR repeat protein